MVRIVGALAVAVSLSACATPRAATAPSVTLSSEVPVTGWRATASAEDEARLGGLPAAWATARSAAQRRDAKALAAVGDLLRADAALDRVALPPGSYKCWMTALGRRTARGPALRSFPPFFCHVRAEADGKLSFAKQTGSELPGGWLHDDGDRRYVFLGARQRAPGDTSLGYGVEPARDIAGVVERIGPFRWRLALPWRDGRPGLDVYELTPVPTEQQAPEPAPAAS